MPLIDPNKKAPAFSLPDQSGTVRKLSDYAGKPVILFFYPKDMTSGCTAQACAFQESLARFKRSKAQILGISILDSRSKAKFAQKEGLTYPLLADEDATICEKYGVWQDKSMYGKTYKGIVRTTYLIGADGKVVRRWDKVKVPGHDAEVLEAVKGHS